MFGNLSTFGSLLDELRRWDNNWDTFFDASPWRTSIRAVEHGTWPALNVGSSSDSVDVYLFAAGIDPKALDIQLQQNLLTISGERKAQREDGATYYRRERFGGSFQRVIALPEDVDPDKVAATYRDGVLHVRVSRREEVKPRRIEVH